MEEIGIFDHHPSVSYINTHVYPYTQDNIIIRIVMYYVWHYLECVRLIRLILGLIS